MNISGIPKDRSWQMGIREWIFQARAEGAADGDQTPENRDPIGSDGKIGRWRQMQLGVELWRQRLDGIDVDIVAGDGGG